MIHIIYIPLEGGFVIGPNTTTRHPTEAIKFDSREGAISWIKNRKEKQNFYILILDGEIVKR